jgi:GTP-binding nuclear protein Ran
MLLGGAFEKTYVPTLGVEVHPVAVKTTSGDVVFKVWDVAGQDKLGGLRDAYYLQANAAIIFYDVTSHESYKNVALWHRGVFGVNKDMPCVLVGNKACSSRSVAPRAVTFHRKKNIFACELDVKPRTAGAQADLHMWLPLLFIARKLLRKPDLNFLHADGSEMNVAPLAVVAAVAGDDGQSDADESED